MRRRTATWILAMASILSFAAWPAGAQSLIGVLGGTALSADDAGAVVAIAQNGAATVLGTPIAGESLTGVVQLPDGRVVASTATFTGPSRLIQINPATGSLIAEIGPFLNGQDPVVIHDLAADPVSGTLYGAATGDGKRGEGRRGGGRPVSVKGAGGSPSDRNAIFSIDPDTGACTYLGTPSPLTGDFLAIAFSADNGHLWGMPANAPDLFEMDPATVQITQSSHSVKGVTEGALGMAGGQLISFVTSGCCEANVGNDIYAVDGLLVIGSLMGPAGGNRRVHDLAFVTAGPGPGQAVVEVPILGKQGITALALLLAVAGGWLLKRR